MIDQNPVSTEKPARALQTIFLATLLLLASLAAGPAVGQPAASTTGSATEGANIADDSAPAITVSEELLVEERLEGDDPWLAERATTATKIATPRHLTPLSISAVSERLLDEQDVRTLGDALENIPGVTVTRLGGSTDVFILRGFESLSSASVLTDGTVEPEVSLYQTYNVERVEAIRGPASFFYGGTALAGAINLVRKRPTGDRFARVSLLGGSDSTLYGSIDLDTPVGRQGGFRFNAFGSDTDGYRDGREATIWAANPSYRHRFSDRFRLDVHLEVESADIENDGGIPLFNGTLPDIPRTRSFDVPLDGGDRDNVRLHIDLEAVVSPRMVIRNKLWSNRLDQSSLGTIVAGAAEFPDFGPVVFRALNILDDEQDFLGERFEAFFDLGKGSTRHQIVAGLELQRQKDDFVLFVGGIDPISLFQPVETFDFALFDVFEPLAAGNTTIDIIAPYVADTISLGRRTKLTLGARFDSIDTDDRRSGVSFSEDQLSPFAGLVVAPNERWTLYANYGESFDPPSVTVVAAARRPEEGRQVEVGAKGLFADGRVSATLAFFQIEKESIAIANATGFLAQLGDQESAGFELELVGRTQGGLHWRLAYAYTNAELTRFTEAGFDLATFQPTLFDFSGNDPAWVPENVLDAWVGTRFRNGFGLAGGARWVDSRFTDENNAIEVDSYLTLGATATYTRGGHWTARLHLKNLTDEDYELRAVAPNAVLPADGFNLQAGIDLSF